MRIEVLIGNDDPLIYPLNKPKITLGNSEHCDIVLEADGLSRKHIVIHTEGDNYYVIDQGSTNGSFINEERLIPGKKVEFTSFFPVRLGDQVLVSLLSDEEGETGIEIPVTYRDRSSPSIKVDQDEDRTSVISLSELNKVKTEKLVLQRNQKRSEFKKREKKPQTSKPKKKPNYFSYLILAAIVGAGVYNYMNAQNFDEPIEVAKVGEIVKAEPVKEEPKEPPFLIPQGDVPTSERVAGIRNNLKCTTETESFLCDYFPHAREEGFGVVQSGLTYFALVNAGWFFEEAKKFTKKNNDPSPEAQEAYNKLLKDVAAYLYLMRLSPEIDLSNFKDMNVVIGLFKQDENGVQLIHSVAMKMEALKKLKEYVFSDNLMFTKTNGASALNITEKYYRTF